MPYKITWKDRLKAGWQPICFIAGILYVVLMMKLSDKDHIVGLIMLAIFCAAVGLGVLTLMIWSYRSEMQKIIQEKEQGM